MIFRVQVRRVVARVLFFFPFQLLLLHLKKNHLILLCWLVFFGYITQSIGLKYGIPYIFLFPEYFGTANVWSFMLLGFSLGGFITGFNLFTYTAHAYRFPFVATLARPFLKFNLNNGLIPLVFVLTYLWNSAELQITKELVSPGQTALHLLAFLFGMGLFFVIALLYFTRTNTDLHKILAKDADAFGPEPVMEDLAPPIPPVRRQQRKASRWLRHEQRLRKWRVETYLTWPLGIRLARSSKHYEKDVLREVLWQNHINGSIFEIVVVITFIGLGAFSNLPFFAIPAGASIFLLFTMLLMLFTALTSWVKDWMVSLVLIVVILFNAVSLHTDGFLYDAQAYGLDYKAKPATYDRSTIHALATDTAAAHRDAQAFQHTLERWLARNEKLPHPGTKPPLVIINTSGGGSRAMLWTFRCMQVADSLLHGSLMGRTVLMTGSSGGLIGATYYRQLAFGAQQGLPMDPNDPVHLDQMASDILNPVMFSLVTNDMFIRYRRVHDGKHSYTLDRGFAFEQRLDSLTGNLFNVRLGDMALPEQRAETPMLVISPTSINDGRRVIISSQPVAFLTDIAPQPPVSAATEPESIEFQRLFKGQDPADLKLSSALRMNASFPYVTPVVTLPSKPKMRVMDAGTRDNYGYRTTMSFLEAFRGWIEQNAGSVVIIQVRDKQRELQVKPVGGSMLGRLVEPVGSIYGNFVRGQDQDYDLALKTAEAWMPVPLHVVDLQLRHEDDDEISLSWHLTAVEKQLVLATIGSPENQRAFSELRGLVLGNATAKQIAHDSATVPAWGPPPQP
jgi:hypothetical protein